MSLCFFIFSCLFFSQSVHALDCNEKDKINKLVMMDMQGLPFEERHNSNREEHCDSMSPVRFVGLATKTHTFKFISAPKQTAPKVRFVHNITIKK